MNKRLCTDEELEQGVIVNLASRRGDRPVRPVFVSDGVTAGVVTHEVFTSAMQIATQQSHTFDGRWGKLNPHDDDFVIEPLATGTCFSDD